MATGDKVVTLDGLKAVFDYQEAEVSDLKSNFNTLDAQLDSEVTSRTNADTALSNRINALQGAVGSPMVAATASAMTDTSKIYVYTGSESGYTNGNWYYYNGSAWVSGGVYNAVAINTDKTLTVSDMAADAKVTGDEFSALSETITKNLSPIATMTTTGGGNINASCGSVGHVESGNQYTLSLTNETTKTSNLSVRIIEDGTTTQTVIGNKTLAVGERTVYAFIATLTGNVVLNTALGSEYASTVVFTDIQLEVGNVPTWYAKQGELTAVDKIARNQINSVTETLKDTAFESYVFSIAHQGGNIFGYPQNTIPNFISCAKAHWKYVELDIQWSSDNVPVISHDDTRTIYGTSTTVSISNTSYADLQNMQFFADATIKIPSFYDAIDICKLYGLTPFVELKTNVTAAQITIIINYLKRKKLFSNAFITSFQLGTLITVITIDNNTNTLLNVSSTASIDDLIASDNRITTLLNHAGKTAFAFSYTLLAGLADAKTHLSEYSDTGAYICVYTLDTEALITTYAPMCDYITSNALRVEEVIA